MARVAEDRQLRQAAVQLDGNGPHRVVAVAAPVDRGEAAVDDAQAADAGVVDALHGPDPQFEVGADGVLDQYGDVAPAQRVGDFLHGKGVGRRAGPDPEQIDAPGQCRGDVLVRGHLRGGVHARFPLHAAQPGQTFRPDPLEPARKGAGLPEPGAVDAHPLGRKLPGRAEYLLLGLGAARPRNDKGSPRLHAGEKYRFEIVHVLFLPDPAVAWKESLRSVPTAKVVKYSGNPKVGGSPRGPSCEQRRAACRCSVAGDSRSARSARSGADGGGRRGGVGQAGYEKCRPDRRHSLRAVYET